MSIHKVKVEQAGGKYGTFKCPICDEDADYKFSAASGSCQSCGAMYTYFGGADLTDATKGKFGPHWIELQSE